MSERVVMSDRIPILFDRALRPEWLDYALEQSMQCADPVRQRQVLRIYLEPRIKGQEALNKTVTQLQRVVGPRSPLAQARRGALHEAMGKLAPDERTPLRLQLLLGASPFFADCVAGIRKMSLLEVRGITVSQLNERLVAKYGDRTIVPRSTHNVLQTLALLGALTNKDRRWSQTSVLECAVYD